MARRQLKGSVPRGRASEVESVTHRLLAAQSAHQRNIPIYGRLVLSCKCATFVDKITKGRTPADLPTVYRLIVNLKTVRQWAGDVTGPR